MRGWLGARRGGEESGLGKAGRFYPRETNAVSSGTLLRVATIITTTSLAEAGRRVSGVLK